MTIRKKMEFTPEDMLSAPRQSAAVPNQRGTAALFSESTYSLERKTKTSEIRNLDWRASQTSLVTDDKACSNALWLDNETVAMLRATDSGTTHLIVGPVKDWESNSYVAGTIEGPADNLKITYLGKHKWGVAVSASVNPDGSIYNPKAVPNPRSTGRLYSSNFVRHWDRWVTRQRNAIFYGELSSGTPKAESSSKTYTLSTLTNALEGTSLESPIPPFGGTDHFDLSKNGIVFVAKDPTLDPSLHTKCNIYIIPLSSFLETTPIMYSVLLDGLNGAMTSPTFSRDGKKIAFLVMREDGYEADQNHIVVIPDVTKPSQYYSVASPQALYQSPQSLAWSHNGYRIYWTSDHYSVRALHAIQLLPSTKEGELPEATVHLGIFSNSSVEGMHILPYRPDPAEGDQIFLSTSSLTQPRQYVLLRVQLGPNAAPSHTTRLLSYPRPQIATDSQSTSPAPDAFGLSRDQVSHIYTPASRPSINRTIDSLLIKPPNFSPSHSYPLALLIHGGPQGAWNKSWSTRWNPLLFASQGYVVVCPNITGSTGYGQPFCDAIKEDWGGAPYRDLENVFKYLEDEVSYIDTSRAVALGASYGGYMINWVQGHDLGRKFKALVTHDGIFSTGYGVATEELYFVNRDLGGASGIDTEDGLVHGGRWTDGPKKRAKYAKFDPAQHTENWATPHLIIHSEKDYRLTMSDGIAAFNCLQMRGVDSELLTFPDENHFVLEPENSLVWHYTVFNFINERVGLPAFHSRYVEGDKVRQDPSRPGTGEKREVEEMKGQQMVAR